MYQHKAVVNNMDATDGVIFNWHWPRGTFEPRMSAMEIAEFILPHMPNILPHLALSPSAQKHFELLFLKLATSPKEILDEVVGWIKPVIRTEEDDLIQLNINGIKDESPRGIYLCS